VTYAPDTGRRCTRLRRPDASCAEPVRVVRGSSRVLPARSRRRRSSAALTSRTDRRHGHSADSSRRRRGPPTSSRPAAANSSTASSPSHRSPDSITYNHWRIQHPKLAATPLHFPYHPILPSRPFPLSLPSPLLPLFYVFQPLKAS